MIQVRHIESLEEFNEILEEIKIGLYPENVLPFTLSNGGDFDSIATQIVAFDNEKPAACMRLYSNNKVAHSKLKTLQIGNYECVRSNEVASAIFAEADNYAIESGFEYIVGPMNGSTWFNYRFKINTSTANFFLEPYHREYYISQFEDNGFDIVSKYISSIDRTMSFSAQTLGEIENKLKQNGVVFRNIRINAIEEDLKKVHALSTDAFVKNPFYTSLSWEKFWEKNKDFIQKLNSNIFIIAECNDDVIGYIFTIDNFFNSAEKQAIVKTLAVSDKMKYKGMGFILLNKLIEYLRINQYTSLIHAFMYENNTVTRMSRKYSYELHGRYALFGKRVE